MRTATRIASAITILVITGAALAACSSPTDAGGSGTSGSGKAEKTASPTPTPKVTPADLAGEWEQSNKQSPDSYQAATITANTIEVSWVSDGGSTTSLYWAGTYTPPTASGDFTWTSQNDTSKTESALLASSDPTKDFAYADGTISYKVSALGTTTTVELKRK